MRDTLAGDGTLNWAASTPITTWDGIILGGTPQRITKVYLGIRGLSGTIPVNLSSLTGLTQLSIFDTQLTGPIPPELGNLTNLTALNLIRNRLTGSIPMELDRLTNLESLELYGNQLTGPIPTGFGSLANLEALHLDNNQLTGPIPPELGRLTNLQWLTLHDNQLTGEIPAELVRLTNLEQLWISGNQFSGCVPAELRSVPSTDRTHRLRDIGIPHCDVLLTGLSISPGTLSPQFNEYVTAYTAAANESRITVSPTNRHNATFEYLDGDDNVLTDADRAEAGHQVDVPAGNAIIIKVKVISEDRAASNTYTIQATGHEALSAPVVNTQIAADVELLTVSWLAPSNAGGSSITAYDLRHIRSDAASKTEGNWTVVQNGWIGSGSLQYVLTGLANGTQYDVQVRAVNDAGDGPWSATVTGTTAGTVATAPTGLTATANGQSQIDLSWQSPASDGGAAITGYQIQVSADRSSWSDLVADTGSTGASYSHTGLTAGSTRHYRVSAINSAGTGPSSDVGEATTESAQQENRPPQVVGKVDNVTAKVGETFTVDISHAFSDPDSDEIVNYGFGYGNRGVLSGAINTRTGVLSLIAVTVGETAIAVDAQDSHGLWSVLQDLFVATVVPAEPGAPTGLTATANGQTQIDLSWTAPSDDGGAAISGYRIEVSEDNSAWSDLVANTNSTGTSYSHTGLTAGVTRHYRVSAINSDGTDPASNSATATTEAAPAPDLVVDRPTVSESTPDAGASFTLNATVRNQGSGSSSFTTLHYYKSTDSTITTGDTEVDTDFVSRLDASESGDESGSLTAPDTPGTYYYGACVEAVSGESDTQNNCSSAVTVTVGAASAPDLVVDRPTVSESTPDAGASFTLNATVRNQGSGSSSFTTLHYYKSTDSTITTGDTGVGTDFVSSLDASESGDDSVSLTAPDTPGTYYYGACVEAVSGESDTQNNCSGAVTVIVSATASVPNSPTGLTATANGQTRIDLSWSEPSDDSGSAITGYRVEVSTNRSSWSDLVSNTGSTNTSYSHTGLTAGSTRHYRVSAINSTGTGSASNTDSATTETASAPDVVLSAPRVSDSNPTAGASFIVNITAENEGSANSQPTTLRFYRSADSTITSSDSQIDTASVPLLGPGGGYVANTRPTAPSTPGTYYYGACVDAVSGESDTQNNCSSAGTVTVSATASVPESPTRLTATANGQTQIDLSWTASSDDGGAAITGYRIEVSEDNSTWSNLVADTNSTAISYSHTGLTAGTTRHYRVSAINSAGPGPASNTDSATTDAPEQAEADTCATGNAVSDAANNPGLVADCETLLAARETLRGTATLNWSADTAIASWDAVTVSGVPRRVTKIDTSGENLNLAGKIPSELGNLSSLTNLRLSNNELTGSIPAELGNLSSLESLSLWNNKLTGPIPTELGSLSNLTFLRLNWNQLTGSIPSELGNLTNLESMYLGGNRLTGTIPSELGRLTNLRSPRCSVAVTAVVTS